MTIFIRAIPEALIAGYNSGAYTLVGSVIREVATGRGVGFLQESGVMQLVLDSLLKSGGNPALGIANLALGSASIVQNQQIKGRLSEVQASMALLQNLQISTLAVTGLGLGVSVAGFAVMLKRLKGIETHLSTIEAKVGQVTKDRRDDDLRMVFADVGTQLEAIDTLSARTNKVSSAEAAERAIATSAGRLEMYFQQKSDAAQTGPITVADLDLLWSLAAAIRLCHEAGHRALYSIDELQAARALSERHAQRFLNLTQTLSPDALARLCAHEAKDVSDFAEARRAALPHAETLVTGLRETVASISSQSELAAHLIERDFSGPAYLQELAEEKDQPLLFLPA
jgi:hypothetical protein